MFCPRRAEPDVIRQHEQVVNRNDDDKRVPLSQNRIIEPEHDFPLGNISDLLFIDVFLLRLFDFSVYTDIRRVVILNVVDLLVDQNFLRMINFVSNGDVLKTSDTGRLAS